MSTAPPIPRAPAVAVKLAEAEALLASLHDSVAPLALAESEGLSGAKRDLQALEAKLEAAKRERHKLRQAHRHAVELDRKADIAAATKMREQQFSDFKVNAERRLAAAQTLFEAIAVAVPAMSTYAIETNKLVSALPSGTSVGILTMGHNGWAGSWVGDLSQLVAAEAYRLAKPDKDGRGARLPFAKAPDFRSDDPVAIEPAMDLLRAAQEKAISEIQLQLDKLNNEQLAALGEAA